MFLHLALDFGTGVIDETGDAGTGVIDETGDTFSSFTTLVIIFKKLLNELSIP